MALPFDSLTGTGYAATMPGRDFRRTDVRGQLLLVLMLCALFARAWIPTGWMPDRTSSGYTISLCTGMGAVSLWVDEQGTVHKNKPVKSAFFDDQPCAFAGMFNLAALPNLPDAMAALVLMATTQADLAVMGAAVGHGLAAPPPPPTGPPITL